MALRIAQIRVTLAYCHEVGVVGEVEELLCRGCEIVERVAEAERFPVDAQLGIHGEGVAAYGGGAGVGEAVVDPVEVGCQVEAYVSGIDTA